uniref:NADH dehydrogenase subunit 4L n=1 Tax=Eucosmetus incisus TaxID=2676338 RepID=UPI002E786003|nr:NADH dehydrogenase subunit 4L [Eucosmetus incisus]WQH58283.1 NADH dehydrogenase subunit 4L [Eucosmetus incisus]
MNLLIFMFFGGFLVFCLFHNHFLIMLISLEFLVLVVYLSLFFFIFFYNYDFYYLMLFLVFSVCEGSLGLGILVNMIRSHGNDMLLSLSILSW